MNHIIKCLMILLSAFAVQGCKDVVSPHITPQGDPTRLVASMAASTNKSLAATSGAEQQVVLTLNNAPEANEPLEQDFITEVVELFEKRNPNIRIQYSPWQYTPESFFERLKNRTLTDIVEVDAEQMVPIIEANAAADLTEDIKVTPEIQIMNPDVFTVTSKNGRTYGVPTELHTLALFYNRSLFEASKIVIPPVSEDKPKGKGAEDPGHRYVLDNLHPKPPAENLELAQYNNQAPYYYPPANQAPQRNSRQRFGANSPQRQAPTNQQQYNAQQQEYYQQQQQYYQQQQQYYQQQYPGYQYPQGQNQNAQQGNQYNSQQEDARARRVQSRKKSKTDETSDTETMESANNSVSDDTLTTEAELAINDLKTTAVDGITTVIKTEGLPKDLEQFIRLAVRLTDHKKGIAGYGPVLYAREGGREYSQWAIESGLSMQTINEKNVELDVEQSGDVAQFLKDLHWRFDVTPDPTKCYFDRLMTLFATGKLAMMTMPADENTISELLKRGMPLQDIGITALPRGQANRDHLTYGKCLIVNSQLDKARRTAAFKWLMFMASPEIHRMRAQFFFREKEITAAPAVPLYSAQMQAEYYQSIKGFRSLPLWDDYESVIASNLHLEPSYQTDRFYEAIAESLRPIIERKESDPFQAVRSMASGFENKYIKGEEPSDPLDQLVLMLTRKKVD